MSGTDVFKSPFATSCITSRMELRARDVRRELERKIKYAVMMDARLKAAARLHIMDTSLAVSLREETNTSCHGIPEISLLYRS